MPNRRSARRSTWPVSSDMLPSGVEEPSCALMLPAPWMSAAQPTTPPSPSARGRWARPKPPDARSAARPWPARRGCVPQSRKPASPRPCRIASRACGVACRRRAKLEPRRSTHALAAKKLKTVDVLVAFPLGLAMPANRSIVWNQNEDQNCKIQTKPVLLQKPATC